MVRSIQLGRGGWRAAGWAVWMVVLWLQVGLGSWLEAASVTAALDRDAIYEGETVEIAVTVQNASSDAVLTAPEVPGLTIRLQRHVSFSQSIVNGVFSSSREYRFLVEPAELGEYAIPPILVEVNGETLQTRPLRLRVLAGTNPAISQVALLQLKVDKQRVYVGEALPVEIGVAFRGGEFREAPQLEQEGLTMGRLDQLPRRTERIGGVDYFVDPFRTYVIAARAGKLRLGPATLAFGVPVRSRLGLFGRELMAVKLRSATIELDVQPLPAEGVPAGFQGAVGQFSMRVEASTNAVTAGDPILLTVEISGRGPIQSLPWESRAEWAGFKTYAPETSVELVDKLGLQGTKRFTQVVVPQNADVTALPAIEFSYFDPARGSYETLRQEPLPITVRAASVVPTYAALPGGEAEDDAAAGSTREIVHIKARLGAYGTIQPPLVLRPWFVGLHALPLLAWLGMKAWRWRRDRVARDPRLTRRRHVARVLRAGLAELSAAAGRGDTETFFATVHRLLQERLGEKLGLPATAVDELVLERPELQTLSEDLRAEVRGLFEACSVARYAPGRLNAELGRFVPRVESALKRLGEVNGL